MNEWIDCKDRMPPCGEFVIAYCAHAPIWSIVRWGGCEWVESTEEWHRYPRDFYSHWMPRPGPPKRKRKGRFFTMHWINHPKNGYVIVDRDVYQVPFPSLDLSESQAEGIVMWLNETLDKTR